MFFRVSLLESVVEGEPPFRRTDFLIGTEEEGAGSDRGRFIFLIMFRYGLFAFSAVISFRSSMVLISSSAPTGQYKFQKYRKLQANTENFC
jgi:hypothetical protein